jgi:hypothetical protein
VYYTIFTFRSFPLAPFARKRAQYSKSPEIVQAEVQENLNFELGAGGALGEREAGGACGCPVRGDF